MSLSTICTAAPRVEAYSGAGFGVGRVTVPVDRGEPSLPISDERFTVESAGGRVLYPALKIAPVRRLLRRILEIDTPAAVTMYFLFVGDEPLRLDLYSPTQQTITVTPRRDARQQERLLAEWWEEYSNRWRDLRQDPEFPPVVENFVAPTLARRLNQELPTPRRRWLPWEQNKQTIWDELLATEAYRLELDQELLATDGDIQQQPEMVPLPPSMPWPEPQITLQGEVVTEPIAGHVPAESFYIRFGNFKNYLWFRDLNRKWEGDLKNMILRRGIDRKAGLRIEQQLSLSESALAKIVGPQVIDDVALIGLDPYTTDGAAVGILFQARNNFLLARDLTTQRRRALDTFDDASETTIDFPDGKQASLIASPSGEVRTYYAQDGDFHLVTNSRTLAGRFFAAGAGKTPLAEDPAFLLARSQQPVDREDCVFIHLSNQFFRTLCSPRTWIESQRRLSSSRRLKLVTLAKLMATAEGSAASSLAELIAEGYLPAGFDRCAGGGELICDALGGIDTRRGRPGLFLPIPDTEIEPVTTEEARMYRRFSERFIQEVGVMRPVSIALQRVPITKKVEETDKTKIPREVLVAEHLIAEVLIEPRDGMKLGKLEDWLGPPSEEAILPAHDDLANMEIVLEAALPLLGGDPELHHLFGGVRDFRSPLVVRKGTAAPIGSTSEMIRGYLGAWPKPGLLQLFTGAQPRVREPAEELENAMWLGGRDDFLLLSFKPEIVNEVIPQLARVPAERPAQLRFTVSDLSGTGLAELISSFGYGRARETSAAASRLMNTLGNQLNIPRDQCQELAGQLMDGGFVCALGGEYQLFQPASGIPVWSSNALPKENRFLLTSLPDDFELPFLSWFGGASGDACLTEESITAHLELLMREPLDMELPREKPMMQPLSEPAAKPQAADESQPKQDAPPPPAMEESPDLEPQPQLQE
ncbi:hypothetical protein [Adhaeretor mobilis]|nr:hypothetical protein [Adhaeretor mobilis]